MSEVGAEALLVCMAAEGDDKHGNLGLGGNDTREIPKKILGHHRGRVELRLDEKDESAEDGGDDDWVHGPSRPARREPWKGIVGRDPCGDGAAVIHQQSALCGTIFFRVVLGAVIVSFAACELRSVLLYPTFSHLFSSLDHAHENRGRPEDYHVKKQANMDGDGVASSLP